MAAIQEMILCILMFRFLPSMGMDVPAATRGMHTVNLILRILAKIANRAGEWEG
jgi:hypothetical protein